MGIRSLYSNDSKGGAVIDITAAEAARRLGVTRQAAVVWARSGVLAGARQVRPGGEWMIPESSVVQLKRERETAGFKASQHRVKQTR